MPIATMTSKGQTTIPKAVRDYLNLKPGDQISYTIEDGGRVVLRAKNRSLKDLAGILKRPGQKTLTVEEMNEAIGRAVIENDARSRQ
jgi:antitoxin PrlF